VEAAAGVGAAVDVVVAAALKSPHSKLGFVAWFQSGTSFSKILKKLRLGVQKTPFTFRIKL